MKERKRNRNQEKESERRRNINTSRLLVICSHIFHSFITFSLSLSHSLSLSLSFSLSLCLSLSHILSLCDQTLPMFGVQPVLLELESGREISGPGSGYLAIKHSWPGQVFAEKYTHTHTHIYIYTLVCTLYLYIVQWFFLFCFILFHRICSH